MTIQMNQSEIDLTQLAKAAMESRGFLTNFSEAIKEEIKNLDPSKVIEKGADVKDMRDKLWFSIDNDDSRDLDQLTFVEPLENEKFKIYVAIADVSFTVTRDSAINTHAEYNTTSVYTPTIIFPMLPEQLSTDLTSLNPDVDRSAFVTEMDIDAEGVLQNYQIYKGLVRNRAKLAYNGVGAWLEIGTNPPELVLSNQELQNQLKTHDLVAQKMKGYRKSKGSLSLETIEAKAIIKNRMVIDIIEEKKNRAKEIIENFMIAANTAATKFLHEHGFPAFKRVVRVPKRWDRIVEIAENLGESLPADPDSKALEDFLIRQKNKNPVGFPDLSLSVIKLLGRGEYVVEYPGVENTLGHFGLALRNYSHSTAPNRRFPDLITQRMLRAVLEKKENPYTQKELEKLAEHCSLKEADADRVKRQTQKSAAAVLLSGKINQTFDGIITGVKSEGTWVRIFTPPVEGKLVSGNHVDVGDHVKVKLISVDVQKGFIDFALI